MNLGIVLKTCGTCSENSWMCWEMCEKLVGVVGACFEEEKPTKNLYKILDLKKGGYRRSPPAPVPYPFRFLRKCPVTFQWPVYTCEDKTLDRYPNLLLTHGNAGYWKATGQLGGNQWTHSKSSRHPHIYPSMTHM